MSGTTGSPNGNGELTRDVLRAEMRAGLAEQAKDTLIELDRRFVPVNEHIARIDRGEFTEAQKRGILAVVTADKVEVANVRNLKIPILALVVSCLTLVGMVVTTLVAGGIL